MCQSLFFKKETLIQMFLFVNFAKLLRTFFFDRTSPDAASGKQAIIHPFPTP